MSLPTSERSSGAATSTVNRQVALILFAAVVAIYLRMIAPGLLSGDSGEFQFAAWRLGLAHATGYPLYLILGWLWQHLLSVVRIAPATALNALSAVVGAMSVALFFQLLAGWLPGDALFRRLLALFAALFFAFNPTFWSQNLIAEVYTLQVLLIVVLFSRFENLGKENLGKGEKETGEQEESALRIPQLQLPWVAFFFGLSLAHHAMTLFFVPGLLLAFSLAAPGWWKRWQTLLGCVVAAILPLLLYFYVPLRSGISASPWYYVRLGDETISLYGGGWQGFLDFVSGRSISVGFKSFPEAIATLSQAGTLWKLHFGWIGLILMVLGLVALFRNRNWTVIALTLPFALILQFFNLFYNIGDILVYYIPLYLVGVIWLAFGVAAIGEMGKWGNKETRGQGDNEIAASELSRANYFGAMIAVVLFALPLQTYREYQPILDQSAQNSARGLWQSILAAKPEPNAILVSNDRNEIVPLYYLQNVENFATSLTGLFPLITPDPAFADIGAAVDRALQSGQPVYLIKPMPGLEVRFDLAAATPPLVKVVGPAITTVPQIAVDQSFGPLTLLGYDWQQNGDVVQIGLHWRTDERLTAKYTTTVQLFDAMGEKLTPDAVDSAPGGDYYPTTLWKPGELLLDRHALRLPTGKKATKLLVGMYTGQDFSPLAPPIEIELK